MTPSIFAICAQSHGSTRVLVGNNVYRDSHKTSTLPSQSMRRLRWVSLALAPQRPAPPHCPKAHLFRAFWGGASALASSETDGTLSALAPKSKTPLSKLVLTRHASRGIPSYLSTGSYSRGSYRIQLYSERRYIPRLKTPTSLVPAFPRRLPSPRRPGRRGAAPGGRRPPVSLVLFP